MATVVPPPPPIPLPLPSQPAPLLLIASPPPALAQLPLGTLLEGTLLGSGVGRQVQIQTSFGTLAAQTGFSLPANVTLGFQVTGLTPQLQLRIVSVNGRPIPFAGRGGLPIPGTPSPLGDGPGATIGAATPAGRPMVTLTVGSTLNATLLQASTIGTQVGVRSGLVPGLPPIPATAGGPGSPGMAGTAGGPPTVPSQGIATTGVSTPPNAGTNRIGGAPGVPSATVPAGRTPAGTQSTHAGASVLAVGSQFSLRVVALPQGGGGTPSAGIGPASGAPMPPPIPGTTLIGHVVGNLANGHAIVETPLGPLALATRGPLPLGIALSLEIATVSPPAAASGLRTAAPDAFGDMRRWPAFDEALTTISHADPATARHLLTAVVPRPDSQLATNMMFFIVVLRGGDLRGWLGEGAHRILQNTRPDLLSALDDDFGQMRRLADEPVSGDWRSLLVPFHTGAQVELVRLFTRQRKPEGDDGDGDAAGTRFVVDVDLSRLGQIQLDGLLREKKRHFDLIVRSERPLPAEVRDRIRAIFRESAEITGMNGGVGFQAAPPDFVEILPRPPTGGHPNLMV